MSKKKLFIFSLFILTVQSSVASTIGYEYYGPHANAELIQATTVLPNDLKIPPRPADAISGSEFMQRVTNMTFEEREAEIYAQLSMGNLPDFMRILTTITSSCTDASGNNHTCIYEVMPDYLAIGSNEDFCRIPMGPVTAQKIADLFGAVMPTRKLVDDIYSHALVKLEPVTYMPVEDQNTLVPKFIEHNQAIENQFANSGGVQGQLVGGIKKDVVLSNLIIDPSRPNHVVIYGWHQLNGEPIQPLTNIHINTYVDYSHGIRLLNTEMLVDSVVMDIKTILADPILYKMLSDETGPMNQPSYIVDPNLPAKPASFGIQTGGPEQLNIIIPDEPNVESYNIYVSRDGKNFQAPLTMPSGNLFMDGLETDSIYFVKLEAVNSAGKSPQSEVLAGIPSSVSNPEILIVNGFDRGSTGNTYDFIRQHAQAIKFNGGYFESATNDAVIDGSFSLSNYTIADYILGDESTADETFNSTEQALITSYLNNGGKLFVSGSEIAWDLDYKGSASDKDFIWNYLKIKYINDAPFGAAGVYYEAEPIDNTSFTGVPAFFFDNGTHGTINVKYPDVIKGINGATGFLKYSDVDTSGGYAAATFSGHFPESTQPGKIAIIGFPFETIYPEDIRNQLMNKLLVFFNYTVSAIEEESDIPATFSLNQNYPNPFNPSTTIRYSLTTESKVTLRVFNSIGQEVKNLVDGVQSAGVHEINFNASNLATGIYYYKIEAGNFSGTKKMLLIK